MTGPDFYEVLGVSWTATPDEIKSAHRELVKKYHPDLFPGSAQKARANDKLQQINEAYAVLSNVERRREYDSRFFQKPTAAKPTGTASKRKFTSTFRRPSTASIWKKVVPRADERLEQIRRRYRSLSRTAGNYYSDLAQRERNARQRRAARQGTATLRQSGSSAARNFARRFTRWVSVKTTAGVLGIMVLIWILLAMGKEPEIIIAWTLWESTVVEPAFESKAGDRNWKALGYHGAKALCVESLKQRVALDEREGSKVFLDERNGTIAMTIHGKTEAALAEELLREKLKQGNFSGVDPQLLEQEAREEAQEFVKKKGLVQRVNQYQCRETQIVKVESWLRRKLRQLGLIS